MATGSPRAASTENHLTATAAYTKKLTVPVPTPTYASYLNRIEATFGALDEFVCKNADYLDWNAFGRALAEHVRHRNSPPERERRKIEAAKRQQRRAAKPAIGLKLAA